MSGDSIEEQHHIHDEDLLLAGDFLLGDNTGTNTRLDIYEIDFLIDGSTNDKRICRVTHI